MTAALAIFVKTPGHSPLKTRLATDIGQAHAEQFHRLAASAVAAVARASMASVEPCWAVAEAAALRDPLWQELPTVWQGEGDLGARLHHICHRLQQRHGRVLLIGADAPQIEPRLLQAAVETLRDPATPFVLGRAEDGGFWLFGTRQPVPESAWLAPRYSSAQAAGDLITALHPAVAIGTLPRLRDVDDARDLVPLQRALEALRDPLPEQDQLLAWLLELQLQALPLPPAPQSPQSATAEASSHPRRASYHGATITDGTKP